MQSPTIYSDIKTGPVLFGSQALSEVLPASTWQPQVSLYAQPIEKWPCHAGPQGYHLYCQDDHVVVAGADEAGAMYGALDLAEYLAAGGGPGSLPTGERAPYLPNRGIKMNIPLDARTPSYSDSGDSAQCNIQHMWDMAFWRGYLDRMAKNRYNVLSLWNLSPFPSLVRIPEYPDVALDDVKRAVFPSRGTLRGLEFYTQKQADSLVTVRSMTMDGKVAFWRQVMEYAHNRCISVYFFTWNVHVYGTEHTSYGITDQADNPITMDYIRCAVKALVGTYPLLAGIGVTAGENMCREWRVDQDVRWVRDTYGRGIEEALSQQPERQFTLIQRAHMTTVGQMEDAYRDYPHPLDLSFKYSQAHMHTAVRPAFGDAFFSQLSPERKTWLTVRDDDFYLLPWCDVGFARKYLAGMPAEKIRGFYLGSDGIIWARDFASRNIENQGCYFFDRQWASFMLWGRLAYDPNVDSRIFQYEFDKRFDGDGAIIYEALHHVSKAIPLLQRTCWHDYDFQWYPEACCYYVDEEDRLVFKSLDDFTGGSACPGAGHLSIPEYCQGLVHGNIPSGVTPPQAAEQMRQECLKALELLQQCGNAHGYDDRFGMVEDLASHAKLGLYYADKLLAAVELLLYRLTGGEPHRQEAVARAEMACGHWLDYSAGMARRYRPQKLSRLRHTVSPDQFDGDVLLDVHTAKQPVI